MRPIPGSEVFTRGEALAAGWSDPALTRAVAAGTLLRPRRGLYAATGADPARVLALAAGAGFRGAVVSHRSALLLHGLPIVGRFPPLAQVTVPPNGRGSAHAANLHRAGLPDSDVVVLPSGILVTSVARTLIDVGRSCPVATAVSAVDAATYRGLVTADDLDAVRIRCWNWPGIRRAHRALALSDARAESPLESISRLAIGWLRLPPPDLQRIALDEQGRFAGRLDFYWDEFGVAGEADGRGKYVQDGVVTAEKGRQEALEDHTMIFVRWGWTDVVRRPQRLRTRIEAAFERGRRRDRSGIPRLWSIRPR